ncbi:MAG TPA: rhodanese-like domain-containing protein [Gaiellaceae bacterium]|nr:rhodanese-like domain-containing protein [Gaiellaceae bacterium]
MEDVTLEELRDLLEQGTALLDVRTPPEFAGAVGAHCDPRQGHIPDAVNLPLDRIVACRSADEVRFLVGLPEGADVVAYCHTGNRSAYAAQVLDAAGYRARNYVGSWHEWSRAVPTA